MKKIILTTLLLASCSCLPKPDCAKIGDEYDKVVDKCGKPDKIEYRAGSVSFIHYFDYNISNHRNVNYFTIGFDNDIVNQIHYDDEKIKIDNYGE